MIGRRRAPQIVPPLYGQGPGGASPPRPASEILFVSLHVDDAQRADTEVRGGGYVRQAVRFEQERLFERVANVDPVQFAALPAVTISWMGLWDAQDFVSFPRLSIEVHDRLRFDPSMPAAPLVTPEQWATAKSSAVDLLRRLPG